MPQCKAYLRMGDKSYRVFFCCLGEDHEGKHISPVGAIEGYSWTDDVNGAGYDREQTR